MKIYIIMKYDSSSSYVECAYIDKLAAETKVIKLNEEEQAKLELYNEWVTSDMILCDSEGEEYCPEFGDYIFTMVETELY